MPLWLLLLLLLVVFAFLVVGIGARAEGSPPRRSAGDDIDEDTLREAEDEVGQLEAGVHPDDADDHLPDWGPGAPKSRPP